MSDIDWASLQKDAQDTVLADGDYTVIVSEATSAMSSNNKPMIRLKLKVADGPKRDRMVFTQLVLSAENPFALQRWFAQLACFGLDASYFGRNPTMEQIAADLLNRGVVVSLGQREWQGQNRNEVQSYRPFAPNGPVPPGMILGPVTTGGPAIGPVASRPSAPPVPSTPAAAPGSPTIGSTPAVGATPSVGGEVPSAPPQRPF